MLAENAMQTAFVPNYVRALEKNEDPDHFLNVIFTIFLFASLLITVLGIIFSKQIVLVTAYGYTSIPEKFYKTVEVTRITFPYLIIVSISALFQAVLNSKNEFFHPALSPALFGLGIIVITIAAKYFIPVEEYTRVLGYSVLFGGLLQLLYLAQRLEVHRIYPKLTFNFHHPYLRDFGKLLIPVLISVGFSKIAPFINTLIATFLREGSISYLTYAYRLMQVPVGLFAVGLQTVSMPSFSQIVARNKEIREALWKSFFYAVFLTLPSSIFMMFYSGEIVQILFQRGAFTYLDTLYTTQALILYTPHVFAIGVSKIFLNYYFSKGEIKIPNISVALGTIVNITIALTLSKYLDFPALALAVSAGMSMQALFLTATVSKESPITPEYLQKVIKVMVASLVSLLPCYFIHLHNSLQRLTAGFIFYTATFLLIAYLWDFLPEIKGTKKFEEQKLK